MSAQSETSTATGYKLTIGGQTFEQPAADGLQNLVVEDHVDMVTMLTVRLAATEDPGQQTWNFKIGDPVECKMGKGEDFLFKGEVVAVEPGYQVQGTSTLTIRALDKTHRLGRGRKTRHWEEMKDSDVASEVGAECGLSVTADPTDEVHGYILQRNESNIAFIKRLAARNNFLCRVVGDKLEFKKASFQGAAVKVPMGTRLRSMRMQYNSSDMVQKVIVRGWDIKSKKEIVGQATVDDCTPIGGGDLGAKQASSFGDSVAYITDVPISTQGQADAVAKSEMERIARQFCKGSCTVQGDDSIRAGAVVEFEGLPTGQNGKFYVISTRHVVNHRSGYTTEVSFCSNTSGS
jgi:phage protein D